MPIYTIQDNETGRVMKVSGDSPPTDEEAAQLFGQSKQELVAGIKNPEQSARNLQTALGLKEPVSTESVPFMDRAKASFAPTKEEQKAFYETEYGKGSFIPISAKAALVRIPDGKGGRHWAIDNPNELEPGDIAALAGSAPQLVSSIAAGIAATPTVASAPAKLAVASGASSVAGNAIGAIQDIAYRWLNNTPIDLPEIGQRRGMQTGAEAALGFILPYAGSKLTQSLMGAQAARNFVKPFVNEGNEAAKRLTAQGFSPKSAVDLADSIRGASPAKVTSAEAGDAIAKVLNDSDKAIRAKAESAVGGAAQNLDARFQQTIANASAPSTSPVVSGRAAIGGIKKTMADAKDATDMLFKDAMDSIAQDASNAGVGKSIVNLTNTEKTINQLKGSLLKDAEGNPSDLYLPLLNQIDKIKAVTGTPQEIIAVRQLRTMLGEKIGGSGDMFPGLGTGVAKKLYSALSQDIDESIRAFSGAGADKLKLYNQAYKSMLQPLETNGLLSKAVNGGFSNPEDLISHLAAGGSEDWAAAKQFIPPNTLAVVRRSVMDHLMGGSTETIAGTKVANIGALANKISGMSPEVKTELFGSPNVWKVLEKHADEQAFINAKQGLFASQKMPSLDALNDVITTAKTKGFDAANSELKAAIDLATKRRENMAATLVSQIRKGTVDHVAENPKLFFDSIVLDGKYSPGTIKGVLDKLPSPVRADVGDAAFQSLWDKAKDVAASTLKAGQNRYNYETMLKQVFGSAEQKETVRLLVGDKRLNQIQDWTSYMMKLAIENQKAGASARPLTGLIAVAPYHNLFAARATAYAMSQASGAAFLHNATPEAATLFADARMIMNNPKKTAAGIALLQQAANTAGYGDYLNMMQDLSPEQQDAVDQYISIRR